MLTPRRTTTRMRSSLPHPPALLTNQKRAVRAAESQGTAQITSAYQQSVRAALAPQLRAFADRYARELARVRARSGNPQATVSLTWLHDQQGGNVAALQRDVRDQVQQFATQAQATVAQGMRASAQMGAAHAHDQVTTALMPFAHALSLTPEQLLQRLAATTPPKAKAKQPHQKKRSTRR